MQYIKHYYVDDDNNTFCCESPEPKYKRHPVKEYEGLNVKIWLKDSDDVDVCLAEIPDLTPVSTVASDCGKNCIQVLTELEYNSVATPYFEAQVLFGEAFEMRRSGNETTSNEKETAANVKLVEATAAIHALEQVVADGYNPDARDGDGDGLVQDGTEWERPIDTQL
jgi:hypothetical protein